jgi:hypothetical protein
MPIKKKAPIRKKSPAKRTSGGIASYVKKIASDKTVKAKDKQVKELERRLKLAKKEKAKAVTAARKKYKSTNK